MRGGEKHVKRWWGREADNDRGRGSGLCYNGRVKGVKKIERYSRQWEE